MRYGIITHSGKRLVALLLLVVAGALGGMLATAFGPALTGAQVGGEIHGCVSNYTGALRIVYSATQCNSGERLVSWGQDGSGRILDIEYVQGSAVVTTEDEENSVFVQATCPVGYSVVGGGSGRSISIGSPIVEWYMDASTAGHQGEPAFPDSDGWFATFGTLDGEDAVGQYGFFAEAICVQTS